MKKAIACLLTLSLMVALLAGCGGGGTEEGAPIRVAAMTTTVGVPVQFAYVNGFFEEEGIEVEILTFPTGAPINEAFAAGQIDVAASGMASVHSMANAGAVWIGELVRAGGLQIFVRPDHPVAAVQGQVAGLPNMRGSAETISGMQILGPLGTASQLMAITYADHFGLTIQDFDMIHMENGPAWQAFQAGEADGLATIPPFAFEAEDMGYVSVVTFEEAVGSALRDGIFTSADMHENRRDELVKFIRAVYRAVEELQDFDTRFAFEMAWFGEHGISYDEETLTREIYARPYIGLDFMQQPNYVFGESMSAIGAFFNELGTITDENFPNIRRSFYPELIWEAKGINFAVDR